jgi:hypothetical protein
MKLYKVAILFIGLLGWIGPSYAEDAADIASEPHYQMLLQNGRVRVFELTLRPTEKAYVRHDHNFLTVTLQDCEMVMWAQGQSDIQNFRFNQGDVHFAYAGPARGIRNDRSSVYRNITVEFMNPKVTTFGYQAREGTWDFGNSGLNPPVDPHKKFKSDLDLSEAIASDLQLLQGDTLEPPEKGYEELLIATADIDLKAGSDIHIRKSSGDIVWLGANRKTDLFNSVPDPARFVMVALKPAKN